MNDSLEYFSAYLSLAALGVIVLAGWWWFRADVWSRWLPLQRIRPISWKGIDVFLAFWIVLGVPGLIQAALEKAEFFSWVYGEPESQSLRERELLWLTLVTLPLALGLALLGFKKLRGTRLAEMGITPVRAGSNALVGYVQWLLLMPLISALLALALLATSEQLHADHPINALAKQSLDVVHWLMLIAGTVVVAPVTEEILFRGILLPWQVRGGWPASAIIACFTILFATLYGLSGSDQAYNPEPAFFVLAILPGLFLVPFLRRGRQTLAWALTAPAGDSTVARQADSDDATLPLINQKLNLPSPALAEVAIFTNGLFFAAMHSNWWPSPIPLFLLGIGLAWIAYRTSSLVGSITVHALFNGTSTLALLVHYL